jgi:hypothetical protein
MGFHGFLANIGLLFKTSLFACAPWVPIFQTVPYGTDLVICPSLAINCQATIDGSLRDVFAASPILIPCCWVCILEDDEDEYEAIGAGKTLMFT